MKFSSLLFKEFFTNTHHAMIIINELGIIEQFNPSAERLFLYSSSEATGQNVSILMDSPHKENHDKYLHQYIHKHVSHGVIGKGREVLAKRKDGKIIDIFISVNEAKVDNMTHFIAVITHIDDIFGVHKELQNLATFDTLTKTYSRSYFESNAEKWFAQYQKNQQAFSLLMLDLNNFKTINDEFGHNIGDQILITFAERVKNQIGTNDYLVRLGGDEFLIVMQGAQAEAHQLATTLTSETEKPYELAGSQLICIPCIGVYADAKITDLSHLLRRTDFALYAAKNSHHLIQYFTSDLEEKFIQQRYFEHIIREAIAHPDAFHLLFQPQVDLHKEKILGFETLLRLKYHDKDILPGYFIPIIEHMGLAEKLNTILLDKLLQLLKQFQWPSTKIAKKSIKIAFNFSPQVYHLKIHLEHLLKMIHIFHQNDINIQFEIEITESKLIAQDMKYPEQWTQVSKLLKKYHVNLAVDDFSREYSSIYRLLEYHVHTLKIDKLYVDLLLNKKEKYKAQKIIKFLSILSQKLHITVIAEGVETEEQVTQLKTLGCNIGQGFYFFHPLPPEEAFALIGVKLL